jgi:hypothetical protein
MPIKNYKLLQIYIKPSYASIMNRQMVIVAKEIAVILPMEKQSKDKETT